MKKFKFSLFTFNTLKGELWLIPTVLLEWFTRPCTWNDDATYYETRLFGLRVKFLRWDVCSAVLFRGQKYSTPIERKSIFRDWFSDSEFLINL